MNRTLSLSLIAGTLVSATALLVAVGAREGKAAMPLAESPFTSKESLARNPGFASKRALPPDRKDAGADPERAGVTLQRAEADPEKDPDLPRASPREDSTALIDRLLAAARSGSEFEYEYSLGVLLHHMEAMPGVIDRVVLRLTSLEAPEDAEFLLDALGLHAPDADPRGRSFVCHAMIDLVGSARSAHLWRGALQVLVAHSNAAALDADVVGWLRPFSQEHADPLVRAVGLWLVARSAGPAEMDSLLLEGIARDPDPLVRETAAEGLRTLASGPLSAPTRQRLARLALEEASPRVRAGIEAAIETRGSNGT